MGNCNCCCGCWVRFWKKHDPDDVFAYSTLKIVKIRDRYLGLMHYTFMILIFTYIVGIQIVYFQSYLKSETPVGTVKLSLRRPQYPDPCGDPPLQPCQGNANTPPDQLPYCVNSNAPYPNGDKLVCYYWDENSDVYPAVEETAIFGTSRVSLTRQSLSCDITDPSCDYQTVGSEIVAYIADIGNFTLRVIPRALAPTLNIVGSAYNMRGYLMQKKCPSCSSWVRNPNYDFSTGRGDIMSLNAIMDGVFFDLDSQSEQSKAQGGAPESNRYDGIVFLIEISFNNKRTGDWIEYEYKPLALPFSSFKAVETVYNVYPTDRWLVNRHGIRLIFLVTGSLSKFDFTTLLIQLTTSLALYKVAVLLVDMIALYLMPQRKHYRDYKFELTEDFSDVRDREREEKARLKMDPQEELGENPENPFAVHAAKSKVASKNGSTKSPMNGAGSGGAASNSASSSSTAATAPINSTSRLADMYTSARASSPRTDYTRLDGRSRK